MKVAIIDYGHGNFGSLRTALNRLAIQPAVWHHGDDVEAVDWVIFPGVGSLKDVMAQLTSQNVLDRLESLKGHGTRFLGICLGLQLFFDEGEEGGPGLGWIPGRVPQLDAPVLPHIGWNTVTPSLPHDRLWRDLPPEPAFYFVHSYYVAPENPAIVRGTTEYHQVFPSVIVAPPLIGVQFHPELSGRAGHQLLKNILEEES